MHSFFPDLNISRVDSLIPSSDCRNHSPNQLEKKNLKKNRGDHDNKLKEIHGREEIRKNKKSRRNRKRRIEEGGGEVKGEENEKRKRKKEGKEKRRRAERRK